MSMSIDGEIPNLLFVESLKDDPPDVSVNGLVLLGKS